MNVNVTIRAEEVVIMTKAYMIVLSRRQLWLRETNNNDHLSLYRLSVYFLFEVYKEIH